MCCLIPTSNNSRVRLLTGNFVACLVALLITLKVIGIPLAASIFEILAPLGDGVVVIPLDIASARSLVHLKKAHA